ncbi:DUF29 family protein [Crocosphaera sp. UHCC 0190]|uniref:DUF29 family protein n=1 Tax=Crocosphaera sp. UHCC 0190 TaxID=3110246 RepID=UPI002B1F8422|nr:DUF29 family protein [Crocosphaera sp. UHCC 0190]MEA5511324.1 DUF29 family protein [Crocosphaera sp. UHCC 0190]
MEELLELKEKLLKGDLQGSLLIVEELEEMSKDDKISNIISYAVVLLIHLIKQTVEKRTTHSWDVSIRNAVRQIKRKNKRRKAGGYYLSSEELKLALIEAYPEAIDGASLEVEKGRYQPQQLEKMIDQETLINQGMSLILSD